MPINERLMAKWKVNGHSTVVWHWSGDPMVPRSNPLLVKKFLLLSLLIWKGGFEILPNNTWDLLKKAYGTSKKLRFQFRGQLNKPFSEPTYLYTNLRVKNQGRFLNKSYQSFTGRKIYQYSFLPKASEKLSLAESIIGKLLSSCWIRSIVAIKNP